MNESCDVAVIGAGLIGLATAYRIKQKNPHLKISLIEKEPEVATHQSGNNSGVIHSGIYYQPGTLKAQNCRSGKADLEQFCLEHHVNYKILGKLIVACDQSELSTLNELYRRGQANGVKCSMVDSAFIKEAEPHVSAISGIYIPEAGVIDYKHLAQKLRSLISTAGDVINFNCAVISAARKKKEVTLITSKKEVTAKYVINCAGLYSDKIARLLGFNPDLKIIPFRGEYFTLRENYRYLCKTMIYPVPNMNFPFLGVHFTRRISGEVECGPNAILAFSREGYRKSTINPFELFESVTYPGFLKLSAKYWREGLNEMLRSFSKPIFTKALQRLIPEIKGEYLKPGKSGVRAQAVRSNGHLIDDFVLAHDPNVINVLNAPSPGATSCLSIGDYINGILVEKINEQSR